MILSSHGIVASSIGQFDADYVAILNYATTQGYTKPSAAQQIKQNKLLVDLKAGGIWSKLDTFAVFATDGNSDFALIDWKRLIQYTAVNSPAFTTNGGFTGNGTSSYISTNFTPSTQGIGYKQDNASRITWISGTSTIIDGFAGFTNAMSKQNTANHRINTSSILNSAADLSADGWKSINRTSSTNVELFQATTQNSRTSTSSTYPAQAQWVLRNQSSYSTNNVKYYGMGASLVPENTDFYNAVNTYLTSL